MRSNISNGSRAALVRGFMALWVVLAMGLALAASPAEAAPFAYVTNTNSHDVSVIDTAANPPSVVAAVFVGEPVDGVAVTPDGKHAYVIGEDVSVIDTASNTVVGPRISVGIFPDGIAITPDGKHAYVTDGNGGTVFVIDTATNMVVATVPVTLTTGVAVTPDGKHVYVSGISLPSTVFVISVIDTATNTVVATVPAGSAGGIAITPDGKHAYFTNGDSVAVIDTATNTVEAVTIPVGTFPEGIAITPNGTHVYVTNFRSNNVSVIATASNTVVATVPVGVSPQGVAVTPDGKHAYVTNDVLSGTVSVIATASNTVVATVPVGFFPVAVGIIPPPPGVPFLAFNAKLAIDLDRKPREDRFELQSHFTLSSTAPGIHPHGEPVTLQVGTFSITIPPGSFRRHEDEHEVGDEHENEDGSFTFHGVIDGVRLEALIKRTGTLRYAFHAEAKGANLAGTKNPEQVSLTIGGDSGTTSVTADIDH
jgi:YVTN family beta-propeller protein